MDTDIAPKLTAADTTRARVMFVLAFAFLLLVAGIVHHAINSEMSDRDLTVMQTALVALWPIFVLEAIWGIFRRDRSQRLRPILKQAGVVCLAPPFRMASTDPRTGLIWVPRIGWHPHGKELSERLEHAFAGPMVLVALMILPVLGLEYVSVDDVKGSPELNFVLDVSIAVIWLAFTIEFVFKSSAHAQPATFAMQHWLDLAIVVLPLLQFVLAKWNLGAIAGLARAGQALSPAQLARMERLYRLRGVAAEGWHALFLLDSLARLVGNTPEKRLTRIAARITELENEISELRHDARSLEERLAKTQPNQNQPETRSGGATGELPSDALTATKRPSEP